MNHVEIYLAENVRSFAWLAKRMGMAESTLRYKVRGKTNAHIKRSLSYAEYVKLEFIMGGNK